MSQCVKPLHCKIASRHTCKTSLSFGVKFLHLRLLRLLYANTPSKFPGSEVLLYFVLIKVKCGRTECMTKA